jgi:superoxide dismutase, Cu-Zn family
MFTANKRLTGFVAGGLLVIGLVIATPFALAAVRPAPSQTQVNERQPDEAQLDEPFVAVAHLKTPDGDSVGKLLFIANRDGIRTRVQLNAGDSLGPTGSFHGLHIHANDDPSNGEGCLADPKQPADTWFVSADGHLRSESQTHGGHDGDLPSLLLDNKGKASLTFGGSRFTIEDLENRAVIVHVGPDNYGNVPVGEEEEQYTPNSSAAIDKSEGTGNAGDRMACGVISVLRGEPAP